MTSQPRPSDEITAAPAAPAPRQPDTVAVAGLPLALGGYDAAMEWMDGVVARRDRAIVTAAAVHLVMVAREDPETRAALLRDDVLAVPDGQPLAWALQALGHRDASRVYGPALMAAYLERSVASGVRHFLYGGQNEGALVQLTLELRRRFPGVRIVGGYAPPFRPLTAEEEDRVVEDVRRSRADVVWVGIGQPKQEKWMARMRDRLDAPVLVGVGAAFDFHAGLLPQAPDWMQRAGLEWLFRLAHEPRRLFRRYARYNPLFVAAFLRQLGREKRR
jgi:N-acetylglucosaminyldiphosphoundecaprenol N-acetyl-beta-D-mannosaminyltransferase